MGHRETKQLDLVATDGLSLDVKRESVLYDQIHQMSKLGDSQSWAKENAVFLSSVDPKIASAINNSLTIKELCSAMEALHEAGITITRKDWEIFSFFVENRPNYFDTQISNSRIVAQKALAAKEARQLDLFPVELLKDKPPSDNASSATF